MTPPDKKDDPATFGHRLTYIEKTALPDHHTKLGRLGQQMVELVGAHGNAGRVRKLEDEVRRLEKLIQGHEQDRDAIDYREADRLNMLITVAEKNHRKDLEALVSRLKHVEELHTSFPWRYLVVSILSSLTVGVLLLVGLLAALK